MRKLSPILILLLVLGSGLEAYPQQVTTKITAKLSHISPATYIRHKFALKFKELTEKHTNGKLMVDIYPGGQLFQEKQTMEALKMNAIQFANITGPPIEAVHPHWAVFAAPYMLRFDYKTGSRPLVEFFNTPEFKKLVAIPLEAKGWKVLALEEPLVDPILVTRDKPLRRLEDLKGLKIRILGGLMWADIMKLLGISAATIPQAEVYTALKTGVVDGTQANWDLLWTINLPVKYALRKFLEVHTGAGLVTNMTFWNSLPKDIRDALEKTVIPEYQEYVLRLVLENEKPIPAKWTAERGGTVTEFGKEEYDQAVKVMQPIYEKFFYRDPVMKKLVEIGKSIQGRQD